MDKQKMIYFGGDYNPEQWDEETIQKDMELFKMLPYLVTIAVLVLISTRKKRENQPPAHLGLSYFREER